MKKISEKHISQIKIGDTVIHEGHERTVSRSNLKNCPFMGKTLFGDSYNIGYRKVRILTFLK